MKKKRKNRVWPFAVLAVITLLALALSAILLLGAGSAESRWKEQYDLGCRYLEDGNYEEAILAFSAAIEIDPRQPKAYLGRGDAYVMGAKNLAEQGEYEEAMEYLDQAESDYRKARRLDSDDDDPDERLEELDKLREELTPDQNFLERHGLIPWEDMEVIEDHDGFDGISASHWSGSLVNQSEYYAFNNQSRDVLVNSQYVFTQTQAEVWEFSVEDFADIQNSLAGKNIINLFYREALKQNEDLTQEEWEEFCDDYKVVCCVVNMYCDMTDQRAADSAKGANYNVWVTWDIHFMDPDTGTVFAPNLLSSDSAGGFMMGEEDAQYQAYAAYCESGGWALNSNYVDMTLTVCVLVPKELENMTFILPESVEVQYGDLIKGDPEAEAWLQTSYAEFVGEQKGNKLHFFTALDQ